MACAFNEFFANIGKKIDLPLNAELKLPESNLKTIYLEPVGYYEIQKIIQKMKLKKGELININSKVLITIYIYITDAFSILQT